MKYIFDQTAYAASIGQKFNAASKARVDVSKILEANGCIPYNVYPRYYNFRKSFILTLIEVILKYIRLYFLLKKGDTLIIQFPVNKRFLSYFFYFLKLVKLKGVNIQFIIHDLDYLRFRSYEKFKLKIFDLLRLADLLVVHTHNMKDLLRSENIHNRANILYLFDYLTDDEIINTDYCVNHRDDIIFAGNLQKSEFLANLFEFSFKNVKFLFYGLQIELPFSESMKYIGPFKPDNTSFIKGGWGLVWDGQSLDGCTGMKGNYLRYNASHKLSLYITAGIPVIVWNQCGLKEWIENNKLGISIGSLKELDEIISNVSQKDYLIYLESVRKMSEKLRTGQMLLKALDMI